jgi:LAO/AO transport system kinase
VARGISLVENGEPAAEALLAALFPHTGTGYRLGISGPPGSGKSTLLARLIPPLIRQGEKVGVVAVDPSSRRNGGAFLGDRVRLDPGAVEQVFFRSVATRGASGGLAEACHDILRILEASGKSWLIVETAGVGQVELDVADLADTVVVVLVPESGDAIQTLKAGILEAADILVVNKADRPGAEPMIQELEDMLARRHAWRSPSPSPHPHPGGEEKGEGGARHGWSPIVLSTSATRDEGIGELLETILRHKKFLETTGEGARRRRRQLEAELTRRIRTGLWRELTGRDDFRKAVEDAVSRIEQNQTAPHQAAHKLLKR